MYKSSNRMGMGSVFDWFLISSLLGYNLFIQNVLLSCKLSVTES